MKVVIHVDLVEDDLDITIRDFLMYGLKKQDKNQQILPEDEKNTEDYYSNQSPMPKKTRKYHCNNQGCKKERGR